MGHAIRSSYQSNTNTAWSTKSRHQEPKEDLQPYGFANPNLLLWIDSEGFWNAQTPYRKAFGRRCNRKALSRGPLKVPKTTTRCLHQILQ